MTDNTVHKSIFDKVPLKTRDDYPVGGNQGDDSHPYTVWAMGRHTQKKRASELFNSFTEKAVDAKLRKKIDYRDKVGGLVLYAANLARDDETEWFDKKAIDDVLSQSDVKDFEFLRRALYVVDPYEILDSQARGLHTLRILREMLTHQTYIYQESDVALKPSDLSIISKLLDLTIEQFEAYDKNLKTEVEETFKYYKDCARRAQKLEDRIGESVRQSVPLLYRYS